MLARSHLDGSLWGHPAMTSGHKSRNSCGLDHNTAIVFQSHLLVSIVAVRNNAKVWLCFDALSHKYNQSLFQQVHLLTVEMLLWSSMLHLPVFTYHSSYSIQRCDCVCFPSTCDVTGLFLSALNTCPLAVTHSLLLSSQCFTHSCLFLSPNLQILCTQVDLLFSSSKVFFMRMCSGACWGCSLFPFLSLAQPPTLHSERT